MEGSCEECGCGKEVWGDVLRPEGEEVRVVWACGEKRRDRDLGKDSACCGAGAAATWKT